MHFIGPNKPWNELPYRAPSSRAISSQTPEQLSAPSSSSIVAPAQPQSYAYSSLVDRWFDVYDRHYRQQTPPLPLSKELESRKYENVWDQQTAVKASPSLTVTTGSALGLEDLRRLAVEGGTSMFQQTGEGEYRSMPLEGRVDLMRPKKVHPPPEIQITSETSPAAQQHGGGNSDKEQSPWQERVLQQTQGSVDPNASQYPPSPHISPVSLPPSGPPTPRASELNPLSVHFSMDEKGQTHTGSSYSNFGQPSASVGFKASAGQQSEGHGHEAGAGGAIMTSGQTEQYRNKDQSQFHNSEVAGLDQRENCESEESSRQHGLISEDAVQHRQYTEEHRSGLSETRTQSTQSLHSRPASPPLLSWNPAVEPPPNTQPSPSAFPSEAYFPNAWDISPSAAKLHTALTGVPPPTSPSFFEAPPHRQIPSRLIQEGHYRNVMGDPSADKKQAGNQPDIAKVTTVFPWEQKPRHTPGRVFPEGEIVPNAKFIEDTPPEPEPEPEPQAQLTEGRRAQAKKELPRMHIQTPSPPIGYPGSTGYANAWDAVPSIQKYASRLAKPVFPTNQPLTNVSPRSRKRSDSYMSRGDQSDANSMDGDVEDEVDDNSDTDAGGRFSSSERSEGGKKKDGSRRGSASAGSSRSQGKKLYRSYGVQTVPKETRSIAVQVSQPTSTFVGKPSIRQGSRRSSSSSSPAMKTFIDLPRPVIGQETALGLEQSAITTPNATSANVQPFSRVSNSRQLGTGMLSPRLHDSFATPPRTSPSGSPGTQTPVSRRASQIAKPPALDTHRLPQLVPMMRRASSADTADSPLGPISPGDSPITQLPTPRKPAGRTWNPATGVDVFKRTSEEVLARFLRMGSWEDDASSHK